ncbi:MAG: hypothetical protein AUK47_03895 [Deltaproteobacteria bacterium CG2_30_63_29]|nr:MAG: hypothetical protein AUK47_03895 [Deltaproteobacteria bacterium CG2_30_63_29]PJB39859.1 MAG: hypothetical protein CO108_16300 [Deltaproteobacteria bacterium CG_4_9_14_3_um_filter_63_12]
MVDYRRIYSEEADAYEHMVAGEDCDGVLLPAIEAVCPLEGIHVVEVGVGTGRITQLLLEAGVGRLVGVDPSMTMLSIAEEKLEKRLERTEEVAWSLHVGQASALPVAAATADLAIAGWVFGHFTGWYPNWRERVDQAIAELERVTKPGGANIVIETLGTGVEEPLALKGRTAEYYRCLEEDYSFVRETLRTDYQFASPRAAEAACAFFFGDALTERIRDNQWSRIPEWTGLWWRKL